MNNSQDSKEYFGFIVKQAGIHTLIQDLGRFGYHAIGLTNGGPLDYQAFYWANSLCQNPANSSALEITLGGLELTAISATKIAVTGATVALFINNQAKALWRSHTINSGDIIRLGFAKRGMRAYLAVVGGFQIPKSFGSSATVCRESIGGLQGKALINNDFLPIKTLSAKVEVDFSLPEKYRPIYMNEVVLRTIVGYQYQHFSRLAQQLFFSSEFTVSEHCDRMGYRLANDNIKSHISADIDGVLSEGICHGAIQIPADGQPIVLLNDRQTIGGYPKVGAVIALDTNKLAQLGQGAKVYFEEISMEDAHNANLLAQQQFKCTTLQTC
ncbi:MAG: biotin-dependent carboxyltransferase [Alteromonadaceae bacterium]|nr:biotin-dependent carboxyltransferase [Alteromonadaceae bacterium]